MHTDVFWSDWVQLGLTRSYDHDEDDAHMKVPVNPKSKMATGKFHFCKFYFHKYCRNMIYLCQIEDIKIKNVDIYTHSVSEKASSEQIFKIFEDLVEG